MPCLRALATGCCCCSDTTPHECTMLQFTIAGEEKGVEQEMHVPGRRSAQCICSWYRVCSTQAGAMVSADAAHQFHPQETAQSPATGVRPSINPDRTGIRILAWTVSLSLSTSSYLSTIAVMQNCCGLIATSCSSEIARAGLAACCSTPGLTDMPLHKSDLRTHANPL